MNARHIINHNPLAWADQYLGYMKMFDVHASEIEAASPSDALSWHIVDQLKSMARAAFDVQACILRANDIPHDDDVIDNMKETTTMNFPAICEEIQSSIEGIEGLLEQYPHNYQLQQARTALDGAINRIDAAEQLLDQFDAWRDDQDAVDAIRTAMQATFGSETNHECANGMLRDCASAGELILKAIRSAGYEVKR